MRLTKRQRGRIGAVLVVAYIGAFAWLVSPLWGSPNSAVLEKPSVRPVSQGRSLGIALGKSKALPKTLPGYNAVVATSAEEETGSETVSESGSEEAPAVPEGGEPSTGSSSGGEASRPSSEKQIISSEG